MIPLIFALLLLPLACSAQCLPSEYFNTALDACSACHESCGTCSGPAADECLTFKASSAGKERSLLLGLGCSSYCNACALLDSNYCITCNSKSTNVGGTCILNCDPSCLTCSESNLNYCLSCTSDKILVNGKCQTWTCDSSCLTCSGPNSNQCLTCSSSTTLKDGKCISYTCDSSCLTCSGPNSNQCKSCSPDRLLNGNNQCIPYTCYETCKTCSGPGANQCVSCSADRVLKGNNECVAYTCDPSCLTCSGPGADQCLTCDSSHRTLISNRCETYTCDGSCLTCSGPGEDQCLTCGPNRIIKDGKCMSYTCDSSCVTCSGPDSNECKSCSTDRILNENNQCVPYSCDPSCLTCSGPASNQCSSCNTDRILNENNQCLTYSCDESCLTCSGPDSNECKSCSTDRILNENNQCIPYTCDPSCLACSGPSPNQCSSCATDKTLTSNGACTAIVPPEVCHSTCSDCTGPSESECISCKSGLSFLTGYCYNKCPAGYDLTEMNQILVCQPEINLDVKASYDGNQMAVLTFNHSIQSFSLEIISSMNTSIIFQKAQTPIPYNYSIIMASDRKIRINLDFKGHLLPNNILAISLVNRIQTNSSTFKISNDKFSINLPEYYPYSAAQQQMIKTTATIASAGSTVNTIYSMGSSFVFKSLHSIRSELVDSMINYFIFMNIQFPPNFIDFAKENIGDPGGFVPNVFLTLFPALQDPQEPPINPSTNLSKYALNMTFLTRYGSRLTFFLVVLGLIFWLENIIKFFSKKLAQNHPAIRVLKFISLSFRWNFLINEFISDFQESTFSAIFGIESAEDTVERFASAFGLILTLTLIIVVYFLAKKVFSINKIKAFIVDPSPSEVTAMNAVSNEQNFLERFETLHKAMKTNKFSNLLFFFFLIARSFGFSMVLVLASKLPIVQLAYLLISTVAMIAYLIIYAPIKEKNQFVLTVGYEVMFLGSISLATAIHISSKMDVNAIEIRSNLGFAMIFMSMAMIVMNVISLLIELYELKDLLRKLVGKLKARKKRSSKISPNDAGGSINNSTMIVGKITPSRSDMIFKRTTLKKSLSQQKLRQKTVLKSDQTSETLETVPDNKLVTETPLKRMDTLEEIDQELQRKGHLRLRIKKNYKMMNEAIIKTINHNTEEIQEISMQNIEDIENQNKRLDTSEISQRKQDTIIEIGNPNRESIYVRNTIPSSINEIPTVGSLIFDSLNPAEKKSRAPKLLKSQRYNSRILSSIQKTLPDIDEV